MMEIGKIQKRKVIKEKDFGIYLSDGDKADAQGVLLPKKQVPEGTKIGDELEVFLYKDSEDRLIATTSKPKVTLGETAVLEVKEVSKIGAFLDMGLEKDLLLPFKEQKMCIRDSGWCDSGGKGPESAGVSKKADNKEGACPAGRKAFGDGRGGAGAGRQGDVYKRQESNGRSAILFHASRICSDCFSPVLAFLSAYKRKAAAVGSPMIPGFPHRASLQSKKVRKSHSLSPSRFRTVI